MPDGMVRGRKESVLNALEEQADDDVGDEQEQGVDH